MFAGYLYLVLVSLLRLGIESDSSRLSSENYYGDIQVNKSNSDSSPVHPTVSHNGLLGVGWSDFEHKHILNEAISTQQQVTGWTRANWNTMLRTMITGTGNQAYGKKMINTIIHDTPTNVQNTFKSRYPKNKSPTHAAPGEEFYWGNAALKIYVAMNVKKSPLPDKYDMYDCGYRYALARLDPANNYYPVHLHGYAKTKGVIGQLPLDLNTCCVIN